MAQNISNNGESKRTHNMLGLGFQVQILDWLRAAAAPVNGHGSPLDNKTYAEIAELAQAALEFPVTPSNISSVASAGNIKWAKAGQARKPAAKVKKLASDVDELRTRLSAAEADIMALKEQVRQLSIWNAPRI